MKVFHSGIQRFNVYFKKKNYLEKQENVCLKEKKLELPGPKAGPGSQPHCNYTMFTFVFNIVVTFKLN